MIQIEKTDVFGWESAIRGMRNPMNSWDKSDSGNKPVRFPPCDDIRIEYVIGDNDLALMRKLISGGTEHRKFLRMVNVTMDITAPLYWWKEFDTYKVGTVADSCSTMHKIAAKEFTPRDFSIDHLIVDDTGWIEDENGDRWCCAPTLLETTVKTLNAYRYQYLKTKDKKYWWQMIQLLPSSYNQRRTVQLNYEVLTAQHRQRKNHKLDEWREYCKWIESLPLMSDFLSVAEKENVNG